MTVNALGESLVLVGRWLQQSGYRFITPTPATHARVNARPDAQLGRDPRDVFGWSRPFQPGLLPAQVLGWLDAGGLLQRQDGLLRSRVRFSTLGDRLYAHSAYPTSDADAVFFGPDTYRFAALIDAQLQREPLPAGATILDVGCGAGPGGMVAALAGAAARPELLLADINPQALLHARANAALAGLERVGFVQSDLYAQAPGRFDLIVANPPYLVDASARTYRHGGGPLGGGLSERIVAEGLPRLAPGGRLLLYTGAAIVDGRDPLAEALMPLVQAAGCEWRYWELDPDVFGEELDAPAYRQAERIAAVALVARRPPA
ncbi:methyltransferase [Caenimonas terrae]|uniref:Methyltransferase n=1 Tax=Caenimonas terrae TaxID=696074 RepID=A0ABW0N9W9_9BURK